MKTDCWYSGVIVVALVSMLCICSVGVVAMDEGVYAEYPDPGEHSGGGVDDDLSGDLDSVSGSGTSDDPIMLPSSDLNCSFTDLYEKYKSYMTDTYGVYFFFESGSEVSLLLINGPSIGFEVIDAGSLELDMAGTLWGTATGDFVIDVFDSSLPQDVRFYFIAVESESVDFTSPDAIEAISKSTISYTAATNIPATFSEVGGSAASWLDIDPSTGQITGTFPEVDEETTFTYEIRATSTENPSSTATMTITITVSPALKFLSEPDDPLYATIAYVKI